MKAAPAPEDKWPQGMRRRWTGFFGNGDPPCPGTPLQEAELCRDGARAVRGWSPGQCGGSAGMEPGQCTALVHPQPRSGTG